MRLPHIANEKVRRELIVASIFACRMGFDPEDIEITSSHPDADKSDAVIANSSGRKTLELTMADPVGSGAVAVEHSKDSILSGAVRGAHDKLIKAFFACKPGERPLSLDVHFRQTLDKNGNACVELPRGADINRFVSELVQLSSDVVAGEHGPLRPSWRARDGLRIHNLRGYALLSRYCRSIELTEAPRGHPGMISTSLNAVWAADADISATVRKKASKQRRADWLIVFEWDVPGSLPDPSDLPELDDEDFFERVFVLHPASPSWILEWLPSQRLWAPPIEYKHGSQKDEEAFVRTVFERWLAAQ